MKGVKITTIIIALCAIFGMQSITAQVLISGSSGTPDASSMLDISSTTGGVLIPRMTMAQRDLIDVTGSPTGVMIYQTDNTPGFYYYDGSSWTSLGGADTDWTVSGNDMYNNNTGNTGVGITSPTAKFEVYKDANSNWCFGEHTNYTANSSIWTHGASQYSIMNSSGNLYLNSVGSNNIYFEIDDNTVMRIQPPNAVINDIVNGSIYIGAGNNLVEPSAKLEIESTEGGFMMPRMTKNDRDGIKLTPGDPEGCLIYQTDDTPGFYYYDGTSWTSLSGGDQDWIISGTDQYSGVAGNVGIGTTTPDNLLDIYKLIPNGSSTLFQAILNTSNCNATDIIVAGDFDASKIAGSNSGTAYGIKANANPGTSTGGIGGSDAYGIYSTAEALKCSYGVYATAKSHEGESSTTTPLSYGGYFKGELTRTLDIGNIGDAYGIYAEAENSSSSNTGNIYGIYATATGGMNNYAAIFDQGNVGINVTNPTEALQLGGTNAKIYMNSATSNMLYFNTTGVAAPTTTTRSTGTKIVLYPAVDGASVDYAMGINGNTLWHSVPTTSDHHDFYANTTKVAEIHGGGYFSTQSQIEVSALGSGDRNSYIDFHSRNGSDFDFRLIRTPGINGGIHYQNAGTGSQGFWTNMTQRMSISGTGDISTFNGIELGKLNTAASDVALQFYATDATNLDYQLFRENTTNGDITYSNIGTGDQLFYCGGDEEFRINDGGTITINEAYSLPSTDGASGQVLTTNGSGVVSWVTNSTTKDVLDKSIAEQNIVIQEQAQTIEALQQKINLQEAKINTLQQQINQIIEIQNK